MGVGLVRTVGEPKLRLNRDSKQDALHRTYTFTQPCDMLLVAGGRVLERAMRQLAGGRKTHDIDLAFGCVTACKGLGGCVHRLLERQVMGIVWSISCPKRYQSAGSRSCARIVCRLILVVA